MLLHHIQREISMQLQEAGVSYAPTTLDRIEANAQTGELLDPRAAFVPRRQLTFHQSGKTGATVASGLNDADPEAQASAMDNHWRFVEEQGNFQTYSSAFARRAKGMGEVRQSAMNRHSLFDDIDKQIKEQAEELSLRMEAVSRLRRPDKNLNTSAQLLVARYSNQERYGVPPAKSSNY